MLTPTELLSQVVALYNSLNMSSYVTAAVIVSLGVMLLMRLMGRD